MPTFRPDVSQISPYRPGRPIEEVAAELGIQPDEIVKLASNECPLPPFPEVQEAIARHASTLNRYPDNGSRRLRQALASHLDVEPGYVWVGAGSSELLRVVALAVGGPGTSAVYAWPSFVIYRLASILAMTRRVEVPLTEGQVHDPEALVAAVGNDTTVVYVCNPNNPTGTYLPKGAVEELVDGLPERVLVVVDEAYYEYATAPDYASALPLALRRSNVVVIRTFSKIYGLAGLRVGYAVGHPDTLTELAKAQAPFSVTSLAQMAALEALRHPEQVAERARLNQVGRTQLEKGLSELGVDYVPSQANFVWFDSRRPTEESAAAFTRHGVIVRPMAGTWVRVTVGTEEENRRFLEALADLL